jgi:hypothetical protein
MRAKWASGVFSRLEPVRRLKAKLVALSLTMALALGVAACGGSSSDLLPGATASEINSKLDDVPTLVSEGDCVGAEEAVTTISGQVEALEGVNGELKEALGEAAAHLREVVSGCEEAPEEGEEEIEEPSEDEEALEKAEKAEKHEKKPPPEKVEPEGETGNGNGPPVEPPEPPGQEKKEEPETPETETGSGGVGPGAPVGGES